MTDNLGIPGVESGDVFIDELRAKLGAEEQFRPSGTVDQLRRAFAGDPVEHGGRATAQPEHLPEDPRVAALVSQGVPEHQAKTVAHRVRGESLGEIVADAKELARDLGVADD